MALAAKHEATLTKMQEERTHTAAEQREKKSEFKEERRRKRAELERKAQDKAKEEEAILLDIRARALKELAAMQTKALKVGAIQAGEVDKNEETSTYTKGYEQSPTQEKK